MIIKNFFLSLLICLCFGLMAIRAHAQLAMPSYSNAGIEQQVASVFADAPEMLAIAKCESGFRQYGSNGMPLTGGTGGNYIGIFQISMGHVSEALGMGLDIYTTDGNLAYARYLYQKQGTWPWSGCVTTTPVASLPATTLSVSASTTPTQINFPNAVVLTQNLKTGMVSPEVVTIQQILNAVGFAVAPTGPGSPGHETNMFGSLTRQAVQRFQCEKNITCSGSEATTGYGRVGPKTRSLLLQLFQNAKPTQ